MDQNPFQKSSLDALIGIPSPKPKRGLFGMIFRITAALAILSLCSACVGVYMWLSALGVFSLDKGRIENLANYTYQDNSLVFDRNGSKIGEFFNTYHVFVPYEDLPQHLIDALIAIEDKSFYKHAGVDFKGIARAVWVRLRTGKASQGASTITQQLVRNTILSPDKSLSRKVVEIAWALKVEKYISKRKILELYTNTMFLGNGAYGVGAAAQRYFGKSIHDLTPEESALIAGLFQSPSRYNPSKFPDRAKKRQIQVIDALHRNKMISTETAKTMRKAPLAYHEYKFMNAEKASWFVDYIHDQISKFQKSNQLSSSQKGLRIYTTLDQKLQNLAESSVNSYNTKLTDLSLRTGRVRDLKTGTTRTSNIEAALLATDPNSGDILAMVGGRDYNLSQFNRTVSAERSPGSAFKPIVYTEALKHNFKWSDMIYVSPINIENYRPKNMEDDYLTETTMMRAFYKSMNAPTIEIAKKVGLPSIISAAKKLGIHSPIKEEFGSAIGSSDVTMLDLARVYGTYATSGLLTELGSVTKITNADGDILWERPSIENRQKRVLNQQISYLMTQGMKSVLTHGTAIRSSDLALIAAGKTGTSNDNSDNWFCGYTPDLVSIVWVGTDEHTPIFANVSGSALALPIWDQFMRGAHVNQKPRPFPIPDGIIDLTIHPLYGHKSPTGITMPFLIGNQPSETVSALESIENNSSGGYRNVFRH